MKYDWHFTMPSVYRLYRMYITLLEQYDSEVSDQISAYECQNMGFP